LTSWQIGIAIRAAGSGHLPNYSFVFVTLGSTAVLLITFRALLYTIIPVDNSKKSDDYRRGSPFELFEVHKLFIFVRSSGIIVVIPVQRELHRITWKLLKSLPIELHLYKPELVLHLCYICCIYEFVFVTIQSKLS